MRTETREVPWGADGKATLTIRAWSHRERDMWERKWGTSGEEYVGALIGVLGGPRSGAKGTQGLQLARALADDQRQRFDTRGREGTLEKVALVLVSASLPDNSTVGPLFTSTTTQDGMRAWLADLEAETFDLIAEAVDDVLHIKEEEKKRFERARAEAGP